MWAVCKINVRVAALCNSKYGDKIWNLYGGGRCWQRWRQTKNKIIMKTRNCYDCKYQTMQRRPIRRCLGEVAVWNIVSKVKRKFWSIALEGNMDKMVWLKPLVILIGAWYCTHKCSLLLNNCEISKNLLSCKPYFTVYQIKTLTLTYGACCSAAGGWF